MICRDRMGRTGIPKHSITCNRKAKKAWEDRGRDVKGYNKNKAGTD
jgi:hypothetical protein